MIHPHQRRHRDKIDILASYQLISLFPKLCLLENIEAKFHPSPFTNLNSVLILGIYVYDEFKNYFSHPIIARLHGMLYDNICICI
jgi:hypothetical protein